MDSKRKVILEQAEKLSSVVGNLQVRKSVDDKLVERAEKICQGYAYFYDSQEVAIGLENIDWSGAHIKHQEWPAQLNRFFHLAPLAEMYRYNHDEKYARTARRYIEDWLDYRDGKEAEALHAGDNTLNLSIRLGHSCSQGWGGILAVFLDSESFDDAFVERVLASIERQADFLSRTLTCRGNWRISQLDALVITALRFPFLAQSGKFLKIGVRGLHNALLNQMLPDGVHEERSPGYHDWMTNVMANYRKLRELFPDKVSIYINDDVLKRAVEFCLHASLSGMNDNGMTAFSREQYPNLGKCRKMLDKAGLPVADDWLPAGDAVYPDGGFVFAGNADETLSYDVSKFYGGHTHLSRLSIAYRAHGRLLVADPGIFNYEVSDPFMAYGKSTPAHSTLNINGMNQSDTDAQLLDCFLDDEVALAHGRYGGSYWPGRFLWWFSEGRGDGCFGKHDRIVFWLKGEYILVLDLMLAEPGTVINNCWQLGPMDAWQMAEENLSWWSDNQDVNLYLQMLAAPDGCEISCYEGCEEPRMRGWIGQGNGHQPAPQVEYSYNASADGISAMLLSSFSGSGDVPAYRVAERQVAKNGHYQYLVLETPEGNYDHFAWSPILDRPVDGDALGSDAKLAWLRKDASGQVVKAFLFNGTYLEVDGELLFQREQPFNGFVEF